MDLNNSVLPPLNRMTVNFSNILSDHSGGKKKSNTIKEDLTKY